jgi:hypothetical protein
MRFLLRMAFWLGVVLVLLPSGGTQPVPPSQVSASEALTAAKVALVDLQHFCDRQPAVCTVGSQTATTLGHRAQVGAKILYEFLSERFGPEEPLRASATGSVPLPAMRPSQDTLNPSDLTPPWRGARPDGAADSRRSA